MPYRENDEYAKATEMTVKAVLNVLAEEYEINIQGVGNEFSVENEADLDDGLPLWVWIIIGIFLAMIIITIIFSDGSSSGGSSGGFSSGGFSSGGFSDGGYGGGFSGGGGASR